MPKLDADSAACFVFTSKEGLLSPVAHDLLLRVSCFELELDDSGRISARFDAASLRTVCAMRAGQQAHGVLSPKDLADIDKAVAREVLEASRYPDIRFRADPVDRSGAVVQVRGTLTLKNRQRPVLLQVSRVGEAWHAQATLHQPDFGIKPYSALLGAIRIKPHVLVRMEVPAALL
jgi:hypothetical protein